MPTLSSTSPLFNMFRSVCPAGTCPRNKAVSVIVALCWFPFESTNVISSSRQSPLQLASIQNVPALAVNGMTIFSPGPIFRFCAPSVSCSGIRPCEAEARCKGNSENISNIAIAETLRVATSMTRRRGPLFQIIQADDSCRRLHGA